MDKLFPQNEHMAERVIRVALGVVLVALAVTGKTAWGWIGLLPIATGLIGSCPVYTLLGFSTCPVKKSA